MQLIDFAGGEIDVAIRYGSGRYPGLASERLIDEAVIPVCSPKLLAGRNPPRAPADVRAHTLLHDDSPDDDASCPTWEMWLKAAGVAGVDATRGPRFNQSSLVLEAAVLGQGIALAKSTIAAADLAAGRVVAPFELTLPLSLAYYVVYPESKSLMPKVGVFLRWLREEVAPPAAAKAPRLLAVPDNRNRRPTAVPLRLGQEFRPAPAARRATG
jgi:LysR family glycine cleavage system transcriptional activator